MPRQGRVVAVGVAHHISHRGNNRQDVFLTDEDRRRYQLQLSLALAPCRAELLGWCWMSNHVHLIVVPQREDSLSRLIRRVHSAYAQDFNRRRSRDGHLWRSRFFSCALGPNRLETALLYVDLNPVRAGMTGEATAWEWSSARAHVRGRDETGLLACDRLAELPLARTGKRDFNAGKRSRPNTSCGSRRTRELRSPIPPFGKSWSGGSMSI